MSTHLCHAFSDCETPPEQVDTLGLQCSHLAPPQPAESQHEHEGAVLAANLGDRILRRSIGQTVNLLDLQEPFLGLPDLRQADSGCGFNGIRLSRTANSMIRLKTR